jgi:hypothetical protein
MSYLPDVLYFLVATVIGTAITHQSLVNTGLTRIAWFDKGIAPVDLENLYFKDSATLAWMTVVALLVHVSPIILEYTAVEADTLGLTNGIIRNHIWRAILWPIAIAGAFNLCWKLATLWYTEKGNARIADVLSRDKVKLEKSKEIFRFVVFLVNVGAVVAVLIVMSVYIEIQGTAWNDNQPSISVDCVCASGIILAVMFAMDLYRVATRGFYFAGSSTVVSCKTCLPCGSAKVNMEGDLSKLSYIKDNAKLPAEDVKLLKSMNVGASIQLAGLPLEVNPSHEVGHFLKSCNDLIKNAPNLPVEKSKGVAPGNFAARVVGNNFYLMSADAAKHNEQLIGGPIREFTRLPKFYHMNIGLNMDTLRGATKSAKRVEPVYEDGEKTGKVREIDSPLEMINEAKIFNAYDVAPFANMGEGKAVYTLFMYDVFGYGVGLGTYVYMSSSFISAFCLWNVPFWMIFMLNKKYGLQIALTLVMFPFIISMFGRPGNFWEIFSYMFLVSTMVFFSGQAVGFSESVLGLYSDAAWDLGTTTSFGGSIDQSPTIFAFSVASLVWTCVVFTFNIAISIVPFAMELQTSSMGKMFVDARDYMRTKLGGKKTDSQS